MRIARVVPLRRFDQSHWWFDYQVPEGWVIAVGQLVTIPFQRRMLRGVVWSLAKSSAIKQLRPLESIVAPEPIITAWQQTVAHTIAEQSCSSLGHVFTAAVPDQPKRQVQLRKALPEWKSPPKLKTSADLEPFIWYRSRAETIQRITSWLSHPGRKPKLVIVPTMADGQDILDSIRIAGGDGFIVSSTLTPAQFRQVYTAVRTGHLTRVIATGMGLLLPFPTPPDILIDQAEHPGHKLLDQQPRFNPSQVLDAAGIAYRATSPAPALTWFHQHHPAPPPAAGPRVVWSLQDPSPSPWLTFAAIENIEAATLERPVLLIAPQRGYASLMACRSCGYVRSCPWCGATVQLYAPQGQIEVCRICKRQVADQATCPRCQGTTWRFSGLGVERCLEIVSKQTQATSISLASANVPTAVVIGSYGDIRQLSQLRNWQAVIVISADSLLHWPDFSVHERAWQFLHRLHAWRPEVLAAVQTFHPDQGLWPAWQYGHDQDWYRQELQTRMRLGLPPFREHWLIRRPTNRTGSNLVSVLTWLRRHPQPGVTVEMHSTERHLGKSFERLVLSGPGQPPLKQLLPWPQLFPYPWQVDTQPQSWLL